MNADLEALIHLQETHHKITALTYRIETEIPEHIAVVESELRVVREAVDASRGTIEQAEAARVRLEHELRLAEDKLEKYKVSLMQVKTNDEYRAALNEIDYMNRARSELESSILELMEDSETRQEQLKTLEAEFAVEDDKIRADRKVHEDERDELIAERKGLEAEVATIAEALPDSHLRVFRRIAAVRGGVALAEAANGVCIVCNVVLRPAVYQQVKRNERIIPCDSCGRILYYRAAKVKAGEDAPAPVVEKVGTPATSQGE
ncbi:MAG: C4-type zinc ribbon domain-containing protein [Acidobacteria bacterium]|nr:C4-type zinc ribbon domain-containing protein [Acidobacteriota bacterium]